jgi:hypothetical protein
MTSNYKINTTSSLFSGNPTFAGSVIISNTTAATNGATTGALVVNGGLGISSGNVIVNGDFLKDQSRRLLAMSVTYASWATENNAILATTYTEQVVRKTNTFTAHPRCNRVIVRFEGDYTLSGVGEDEWLSRLYINGTLVKRGLQYWDNIRGADSRSRTLLPLSGLADITGGSKYTVEYKLLPSRIGVLGNNPVTFTDMKLTIWQVAAL